MTGLLLVTAAELFPEQSAAEFPGGIRNVWLQKWQPVFDLGANTFEKALPHPMAVDQHQRDASCGLNSGLYALGNFFSHLSFLKLKFLTNLHRAGKPRKTYEIPSRLGAAGRLHAAKTEPVPTLNFFS